ncbi:hypothetical protein I8J29_00465 [Paenibacillus sp. MWE-103]|uniref:Uncharacterized protein n=1 Tax=Paenibacillus artemisiicola TaxID=1172618 RepID=A0ABS3W372_9BACL|nr:hypothetical protein [Paenibacillus artemisiicola]MBO7742646.1 hypothetical protein [Paenibacillus artemisiicola]
MGMNISFVRVRYNEPTFCVEQHVLVIRFFAEFETLALLLFFVWKHKKEQAAH